MASVTVLKLAPIVGARLPLEQATEPLGVIDGSRAVGVLVLEVR